MRDFDYQAPAEANYYAEMEHWRKGETSRLRDRLSLLSDAELQCVVADADESTPSRCLAAVQLFQHDVGVSDAILAVLDDVDHELWRTLVNAKSARDERVRIRLRRALDEPDPLRWCHAACVLAQVGDSDLLGHLDDWLAGADPDHRNVAIECLKLLGTEQSKRRLADHFERAVDWEDRLISAIALLGLADPRGLPLVEKRAQRADDEWAVCAAVAIYNFSPRRGLPLIHSLLRDGSLAAKQSMVLQIRSLAGMPMPHAWTADGLAEAMAWVEAKLAAVFDAE